MSEEPFVSLSRLFLACSIAPIEGLLRFRLDSLGEYDLTLGGLAPFLDVWTPLHLARKIAFSLDRHEELAALLEWETRAAWSVEDKEESGVVHNWKIGSDRINPQEYSTALMLSTTFPRIHLLPPSSQIRTLLPPASSALSAYSSSPFTSPSREDQRNTQYLVLWSKMTEWSVREYEAWIEAGAEEAFPALQAADSTGGAVSPPLSRALSPIASPPLAPAPRNINVTAGEDDLASYFTFTTLSSLLHLLDLVPTSASSFSSSPFPPTSLSHLPLLPPLPRSSFLPSSSSAPPALLQKIYLIDALSRISAHAFHEDQFKATAERRGGRGADGEQRVAENGGEQERWKEKMQTRLKALEDALLSHSSSDGTARVGGDETVTDLEEDEDFSEIKRLRRDLSSLQEVVARLSSDKASTTTRGTTVGRTLSLTPTEASIQEDAPAGREPAARAGAAGGNEVRLGSLVLAVFVLGLVVGVGLVKVL
ncbi:hypothetical protein JCM11251_006994 [Rhodosporidiobolus azoricus]